MSNLVNNSIAQLVMSALIGAGGALFGSYVTVAKLEVKLDYIERAVALNSAAVIGVEKQVIEMKIEQAANDILFSPADSK